MNDTEQYDGWMADIDQEIKAWNEMAEKVEAQNNAWKARWPQYCRVCGGWGLVGAPARTPEDPGPDPCDAAPYGDDHCHRCGGQLSEELGLDGQPHCVECGWSWNDGLAQI